MCHVLLRNNISGSCQHLLVAEVSHSTRTLSEISCGTLPLPTATDDCDMDIGNVGLDCITAQRYSVGSDSVRLCSVGLEKVFPHSSESQKAHWAVYHKVGGQARLSMHLLIRTSLSQVSAQETSSICG